MEALAQYDLTPSIEDVVDIDLDEWAELPVIIKKDGSLSYLDLEGDRGIIENQDVFKPGETASTFNYNSLKRLLVAGSTSGKFAFAKLGYKAEFDNNSQRTIHPEVTSSDWFEFSDHEESIQFVDYGEGDSNKMAAASA